MIGIYVLKGSKIIRDVQEVVPIKFKIARVMKGLTLDEVAKMTGLERHTVSRIEKGRCTRVSLKAYTKLVAALGQKEDFYRSGDCHGGEAHDMAHS